MTNSNYYIWLTFTLFILLNSCSTSKKICDSKYDFYTTVSIDTVAYTELNKIILINDKGQEVTLISKKRRFEKNKLSFKHYDKLNINQKYFLSICNCEEYQHIEIRSSRGPSHYYLCNNEMFTTDNKIKEVFFLSPNIYDLFVEIND